MCHPISRVQKKSTKQGRDGEKQLCKQIKELYGVSAEHKKRFGGKSTELGSDGKETHTYL